MNECKICLSAYYECQKPRGTSKNLPGAESPTTNNGTYDLSPTYVYILIYYEKKSIERELENTTFGQSAVISFPALKVFVEIFAPIAARQKEKAAKKAAARLSHLSISLRGSQRISP